MMKLAYLWCFLMVFNIVHSQEPINHEVIKKIKIEGFQHSELMKTLSFISDVYAPRTMGTPQYLEAAEWAKSQMQEWKLDNSRLESTYNGERGWSVESFSVEMTAPKYMNIVAQPAAYTSGTNGEVTGVPIVIDFENLESLKAFKGKLKGKILILPEACSLGQIFEGPVSDEMLNRMSELKSIYEPGFVGYAGEQSWIKQLAEGAARGNEPNEKEQIIQFLNEEGAAAVLKPSNMDYNILKVGGYGSHIEGDIKALPYFMISKEQHGRIIRMIDKGLAPTIKLSLKTTFYNNPKYHVNVLAEIEGTDKKLHKQIVFVGAHLDAWHGASGAADNGAGISVMMEAMRILKAIGVSPRRTIRIALWDGEEQGLLGSQAYAKQHLGDALKGEFMDEQSKISVYFNLDHGFGKIRGVYGEGNEKMRPIFESYLQPFNDMGAKTFTSLRSNGTDHMVFDALNIPAFQFIQDPMNDYTHLWHASMDFYDLATEDFLKQQAVIVASFIYHAAMRDEMMPRKK